MDELYLINKKALLESHWWDELKDEFDKARAKIIILSAPKVDAVPVVRCKDCKWFDPNENIMPQSGTCGYHEMVKMFWDFCSRGEVE